VSEDELIAALKQLRTDDIVVQTVATLVNFAGQKLTVDEVKDADEAKKAIDAARHMLSLVPDDARPAIQNALDQVQMAYVRESSGEGPPKDEPPKDEPPPQSKIWTPGS
jgi:hypothetical protein